MFAFKKVLLSNREVTCHVPYIPTPSCGRYCNDKLMHHVVGRYCICLLGADPAAADATAKQLAQYFHNWHHICMTFAFPRRAVDNR